MARARNLADRIRPLRRVAAVAEVAQVRWFGTSVLSLLFRQRVLVLETTGRRSGKRRRTAVAYRELDGRLMVVGGAGGQNRPPDWVANLRAHPDVGVIRRRRPERRHAIVLAGDERQAAWDALLPEWPMIAKYQDRAGYPIPVIVLTPTP